MGQPESDDSERGFSRLASNLRKLENTATNSCQLKEIPGWLWTNVENFVPGQLTVPGERRRQLTELFNSSENTAVKSLVIIRLSKDSDDENTDLFEHAAKTKSKATMKLPTVFITQNVQRCYPVGWSKPVTLSKLGLAALGQLYGERFSTLKKYLTYKNKLSLQKNTVLFWQKRLNGKNKDFTQKSLTSLRTQPELHAQVILTAWNDNFQVSEDLSVFQDDFRMARKTLGTERLKKILGEKTVWKDVTEADRGQHSVTNQELKRRVLLAHSVFMTSSDGILVYEQFLSDCAKKNKCDPLAFDVAVATNPARKIEIAQYAVKYSEKNIHPDAVSILVQENFSASFELIKKTFIGSFSQNVYLTGRIIDHLANHKEGVKHLHLLTKGNDVRKLANDFNINEPFVVAMINFTEKKNVNLNITEKSKICFIEQNQRRKSHSKGKMKSSPSLCEFDGPPAQTKEEAKKKRQDILKLIYSWLERQ